MLNLKYWVDLIRFWILEPLVYALALLGVFTVLGWADVKAEPTRAQLEAYAAKVEIKYGLSTGLLRAICEQESNWRNVAGRHGEIGICQIKPSTALMVCNCKYNGKQVFFRHGSRGDAVLRIQAQLTRLGYVLKPDGIYGPATVGAVTAFQRALRAYADGVVGPATWALLFHGEPYPGGTITSALWNPYTNLELAAAYLVWLTEYLKTDTPAVLVAAYNGGPANPTVKYMVSVQRRWARGQM